MQNKQQMLASDRARATYAKFQRQGVAATVCRGTTGDDFNFFYSGFPYWSNSCLGWVPDFANKPKICSYCLVATPPTREFEVKEELHDPRKELRDSNRLPGQANEPSKSGKSGVSTVSASSKHSSKGNKDLPSSKIKKTKTNTIQKTKKPTKK